MDTLFDADNYEYDLALALLDVLLKKELCSTNQYKEARKKIVKERDADNGSSDGANVTEKLCQT